MTKKTTDMTVPEFKSAAAKFSDDDWRAAYLAETTTEGHTARAGVVDHIKAYSAEKNEPGIIADAPATAVKTDGEISAATPGAQPATNATTEEAADHAATIARLTERVDELEKGREIGDPKEEILKLWRAVESFANQLNLQLPG